MAAIFDPSCWRILSAASLTVASAAGASNSTAVFSSETYAIAVSFPGSTSSTGGVRIAIGDAPAASSTADAFMPANWVQTFKVTPGQKLAAISNDAGVPSISIWQLTK